MSADAADRRAFGWVVLGCVIAEGLCRVFRLPFFPIWLPALLLLDTPAPRRHELVAAFAVAVAVTTGAFGLHSLDFSASLLLLLPLGLMRRRIPRWAWSARIVWVAAVWTVLSAGAHQIPGSLPLEAFLTALVGRFSPVDLVSGAAARLLVVGLVVGPGIAARWLAASKKRARRAAAIAGAVAIALGALATVPALGRRASPDTDLRFQPANEGTKASFFADTLPPDFVHPALAPKARTKATCAGCHPDKVNPSHRALAAKDFHEIHFAYEKIDVECTYCHTHAGEAGFPELTEPGDRRTAYNQRCIDCHVDTSRPEHRLSWEERYR